MFAGYVNAIEANEVDAISSSFGECELFYFPQFNGGQDYRGMLKSKHELFMQGNARGITFLAASGDSGGKGCTTANYCSGGPAHFIAGLAGAGSAKPAGTPQTPSDP